MKGAQEFLGLIADGYFMRVDDGRYVVCGNPFYEPDNGQDPLIVWDAKPDDPEMDLTDAALREWDGDDWFHDDDMESR